MVKVNIDFPDEVHRKAKSKASLLGVHLKDYIIESVEEKNGNV